MFLKVKVIKVKGIIKYDLSEFVLNKFLGFLVIFFFWGYMEII